ncbi:hypothetical protein SAMN05216436_12293 [bacterium A37T11]|nr:hypothetical protein SAMN05216436_12293 [bacterium A37T11]
MSTYEMLLETGEKRGNEKKNIDFVTNLILDTDFGDQKIASLATVSIEFVRKIRASLAKKQKI